MRSLWTLFLGIGLGCWLGNSAWAQTIGVPPSLQENDPALGPPPSSTAEPPKSQEVKPVEKPVPIKQPTCKTGEGTGAAPVGGMLGMGLLPAGCGGFGLFGPCGHGTGRWNLGGGIYYLQPRWETNPAFRLTTATANNDRQFNYDYRVAPLAFLGYEWESGFGIRGRWFQLSGSASEAFTGNGTTSITSPTPLGIGSGTVTPAAGEISTATSNLKLYAYDIEATQTYNQGLWSLLVFGGARYGQIRQSYDGSFTSAGTATLVHGDHTFRGVGPTFGIEGRRQLGGSGFALYGNARGSILFGNNSESATTSRGGATTATATTGNRDVLPIGEIEVGAEYGREYGKLRLFGQVGFVGQTWFGAGNSSNVDSTFTGGGPDNHSNLGLVGLAFRAGITF